MDDEKYADIKTQILANYAKRGKIISEKSVDKYLGDIKKIQSLLGDKGQVDDLSFLYNINDVRSAIQDMRGRKVFINAEGVKEKVPASDNTKRNYFQSIVSVMDALGDYQAIAYYQKIVNDYNKEYKKNVQEGGTTLTKENEEKLIPYEELMDVLSTLQLEARTIHDKFKADKEITEDDMNTYQMYLLLLLYTRHPARNEFATLLWGQRQHLDSKDKNYLVHITNEGIFKLVINEYKTAGLYDTRIIDLGKGGGLSSVFRFWKLLLRRLRNVEKRKTILWAETSIFYSRFFDIEGPAGEKWLDSPMTPNKLSKYLARYFEKTIGKSLSTTAIAKIVISHRNKDDSDNLKKTSNDRGTSVGTLSEVYSQVLPT
tara:strand:+ start:2433 stop:3548 length:1116 start_codon:yes stop_codon:yes gene_type:complete